MAIEQPRLHGGEDLGGEGGGGSEVRVAAGPVTVFGHATADLRGEVEEGDAVVGRVGLLVGGEV